MLQERLTSDQEEEAGNWSQVTAQMINLCMSIKRSGHALRYIRRCLISEIKPCRDVDRQITDQSRDENKRKYPTTAQLTHQVGSRVGKECTRCAQGSREGENTEKEEYKCQQVVVGCSKDAMGKETLSCYSVSKCEGGW